MLSAPISTSTSGDNVIVAGVPGRSIKVISYLLVPDSTVSVKWKSGGNDRTGAMKINSPLSPGFAVEPMGSTAIHFQTGQGEDLILNLSAGVQVSGHLVYDLN